jgi:hypothetical protein
MKATLLGIGLLALAACQAAPTAEPVDPAQAFAEVTFEFDS